MQSKSLHSHFKFSAFLFFGVIFLLLSKPGNASQWEVSNEMASSNASLEYGHDALIAESFDISVKDHLSFPKGSNFGSFHPITSTKKHVKQAIIQSRFNTQELIYLWIKPLLIQRFFRSHNKDLPKPSQPFLPYNKL